MVTLGHAQQVGRLGFALSAEEESKMMTPLPNGKKRGKTNWKRDTHKEVPIITSHKPHLPQGEKLGENRETPHQPTHPVSDRWSIRKRGKESRCMYEKRPLYVSFPARKTGMKASTRNMRKCIFSRGCAQAGGYGSTHCNICASPPLRRYLCD